MATINDFSQEEKTLYAAIMYRLFRDMTKHPMCGVYLYTKHPSIMGLGRLSMDCIIEAMIKPEIADKTPLSKSVWNNMTLDKQAYVLKKIQMAEKATNIEDGPVHFLFYTQIALQVLTDLGVSPFRHDESGFHFPKHGLL